MPAVLYQRRLSNTANKQASAPPRLSKAGCCRRSQPRHQTCAAVISNVAAGSRPSPPQAPLPPSSPQPRHQRINLTSSSLPTILAGLSGGVLLAAASVHLGAEPTSTLTTAAASAMAPLTEFGPADLVAQGFGPTQPVWAFLAHSQHHVATTASHHTLLASTHDEGWLLQDAQCVARDAAATVRDTVRKVCDGYNLWLEESPLMCKIVTGNFFTVAGDMLAQLGIGGGGGHGDGGGGDSQGATTAGGRRRIDWMRTGRLCLETSAFGTPLGHWWFNLLDSNIMPEDPHCPAAVMTKMLADQVLFAPFGLLMFFAVIKCLEGRPRDIPHTIRTSYVKALLGGYLLWPAAGILNFALLPNEYRLLFNNCVNIIWTCFLSIMSSGGGDSVATKKPTSVAETDGAERVPPFATSSVNHHASIGTAAVEVAVAVTALSAALAFGRPGFGCVAGVAVAAVEAALAAHGSEAGSEVGATPASVQLEQPMLTVLPPATAVFGPGASVAMAGPCLEPCDQPVDALYETR